MKIIISIFLCITLLSLNGQTIEIPEKNTNPAISANSGFYENPFTVTISSSSPGLTIVYTLDGSDPGNSENSLNATSPAKINIDPDSQNKRGKTPGVVLRAIVLEAGEIISTVESRTYIFTDKVKTQTYPGWTWPEYRVNDQDFDYVIDQDVVSDPRYKDKIEEALLDIPTLSLITDPDNLFDPETGIYVNAMLHGRDWERPAFVELINPDGSAGFQINCGLRIRGGWSRHGYFPKHAFRLFFREEYGEPKLRFPLFEEEGADRFDKIDLRTTFNYAWSSGNWDNQGKHCTMNRDVFSRDIQREMNNPYTRSRYYHLYLNGCYWGLFQTQERSEAWYAETYLGGNRENYDVIKIAIEDEHNVEATDGNTDSWLKVWNICEQGFQDIENYYRLQGLTEEGVRKKYLPILVDIDNLIDYMIIIFYTGNFDAPTTKWHNNKGPNNFYCIYNRKGCDGYKFFAHDNEHSLLTEATSTGTGILENRVNIGSLSNAYKMEVSGFHDFHPQWLHFKLSENEEYRIRFADRVNKHFFNNGALTVPNVQKTFMQTANMIDQAIIAESARWGDWDRYPPRNKDDDWLPAINQIMNEFFVQRGDIVLDQLIAEDLYSALDPPSYMSDSVYLDDKFLEVDSGYQLNILNTNQDQVGDIFFTTDGNDPREIGGDVYENTIEGDDTVNLDITSTLTIKSRIKYESEWSALNEICLLTDVTRDLSNLKVTEIHYNPLRYWNDPGQDFEFIEFKNTGTNPINLDSVRLLGAIEYTFPFHVLFPGDFVVLASERICFAYRYGFKAFDTFSGNLDNAGENLLIVSSAGVIAYNIDYKNSAPWPSAANGDGYSLVPEDLNPVGDPNQHEYWRASLNVHGSPGRDDVAGGIPISISEVDKSGILLDIYPNPASSEVVISFLNNYSDVVRIELIDINGRLIGSFLENSIPGERNSIRLNLEYLNLSDGIYVLRITGENSLAVKKLVIQSH